jgi:hypothetical protein
MINIIIKYNSGTPLPIHRGKEVTFRDTSTSRVLKVIIDRKKDQLSCFQK